MAQDEFDRRFKAAEQHRRERMGSEAREVYKFCFNGREREWDNNTKFSDEPEEIFTDYPATIAEDFYGELFSTMTPENAAWVQYETGNAVDEENAKEAQEQVAQFEQRKKLWPAPMLYHYNFMLLFR